MIAILDTDVYTICLYVNYIYLTPFTPCKIYFYLVCFDQIITMDFIIYAIKKLYKNEFSVPTDI
jgi:hypothetical protein